MVQRMSQTLNLKAVRNARARPATSTRESKNTHRREQAPQSVSSQLASQLSQIPSGIEVNDTGVSQTISPPTPSQDGASQTMETVVQ